MCIIQESKWYLKKILNRSIDIGLIYPKSRVLAYLHLYENSGHVVPWVQPRWSSANFVLSYFSIALVLKYNTRI